MKKPQRGYYKKGEYIPGEGEIVVDVVGVFTPPEPSRLVVPVMKEKSNVELVDLLVEVGELPFFIIKKLQCLQKWRFSLEGYISQWGLQQWKVLVGGKTVFFVKKPKRFKLFRGVRCWNRLKGGTTGLLYYQALQQASIYRCGFLKRFSRLYRFMEKTGIVDTVYRLWYQQKGVFGFFSRYELNVLKIRAILLSGLFELYIQQRAVNEVFQMFKGHGFWKKKNAFVSKGAFVVKANIRAVFPKIYWPSLKRSNAQWRVQPFLRRWPLWKKTVPRRVFQLGIWRMRRRYVSARWHYKGWFRYSWFKWMRAKSRQHWFLKKPLLRNRKLLNMFYKSLFFLKTAERVGVVPCLRAFVNKPLVKSLATFKKRKRSRKPRRFWRKLFGSWAIQRQGLVVRRFRRALRKLKKRKFPKLPVVKKRGGLFLYPTKQLRFYKEKFSVVIIRSRHWLRNWTKRPGVRGRVVKKRLLFRIMKKRVTSPRFFTKKGRFITLKKPLLKRSVLLFFNSDNRFPVSYLRSLSRKGVVKKQIAPRWPRGLDRVRFNLKTVDCAVDYSKFLQYYLYNKYLVCLKTGVTANVLPDGLINLVDNQSSTAVFLDYLQLLHVHFFERVVSYYDRTSPLFYGAELMSKFIYISGQLLPWYLKYKARHYAWFLINHNKRVFIRKKKQVYKLKILFDRLLFWLYRIEDIRYVWGFLAQKVRMASAPVGGTSFFYKKTLKIRFISK